MANTAYLSMAVISILAFGRAAGSDDFEGASSSFGGFAPQTLSECLRMAMATGPIARIR